jgi:hypothetical protein
LEEVLFPKRPGLMLGDMIVAINGDGVVGSLRSPQRVGAMLVDLAIQGRPIRLTVRRGFPHPFTSHPRLDLCQRQQPAQDVHVRLHDLP